MNVTDYSHFHKHTGSAGRAGETGLIGRFEYIDAHRTVNTPGKNAALFFKNALIGLSVCLY